MQFRQIGIRIVFVALLVAVIALVTQLLPVQQRLSSLTRPHAPLRQEAPTPTAQLIIDGPPPTPTADLNNLPAPVDATATPNQPAALPSCGGASTITGVVLLPDGAPATNAAVQREMGSPADCWAALTNERGEFTLQTLAAGTWVLRAWPHVIGDPASAMPLYQSPFVTITVDGVNAFSLPTPIQLTGAQLVGQLQLANGQPGNAIPVGIAKVIDNPDCSMNAALDPTGVGTSSDATGHFQIGGLPTLGLHCIRIWSPTTQRLFFSQFATVTTPQTQIDLGVVTISALAKHVTGAIRDSNGQVQQGTMSAGKLGEGPNIAFLIEIDQNGHYAFDVEPGVWEVYVFPRDGELANLPISDRMQVVTFADDESEETRVVDFVLSRPTPPASGSTSQPFTVFIPMAAK